MERKVLEVNPEYQTRAFAVRRVTELETYIEEYKRRPLEEIPGGMSRKCEELQSATQLLNYWRTKL
jgi:hypothetical protein